MAAAVALAATDSMDDNDHKITDLTVSDKNMLALVWSAGSYQFY